MRVCYPNEALTNSMLLLRNACMLLLSLALLQGCGTAQPRKDQVKPGTSAVAPAEVSTDARADFETAMGFVKAEEYDKAVELLNTVVTASPGNAIPSINLALVYKKQGKQKLSEESFKQAIAMEPDNPVANNEFALLYRKTGRFAEARGLYEKILEKYPNFNMVHKNLGILCDLYTKDYECALKHYVIYSNVVQDDKTVKIWIADVQKRLGR